MNYKIANKVFATVEEANALRNDIINKTGYVLAITETKAKVTHIYEVKI